MDTLDDPDTAVTVVTDIRSLTNGHATGQPRRKTTEQPSASEETGARANTSLTNVTDLHRSKIPSDDPRLKIERPKARTLRPGPALAAALGLAGVVLVVVVVAASPGNAPATDDDGKSGADSQSTNGEVILPDMLRGEANVEAAPTASKSDATALSDPKTAATESTPPNQTPAAQRAETFRQARFEEFLRARGGSIFASVDDVPVADTPPPPAGPVGALPATSAEAKPSAGPEGGAPSNAAPADGNMQGRKNDFLARAGGSSGEYLDSAMTVPRSPYELKAGTVIPTVLITGINSDLPGQVVGQVRENVYDTVSGNYLLIPQGSRVLASYDSMVAWGQERVLVCWNRVIRPDGTSITLNCMPGVDLAGYAGFSDEVDNHWWKIISGAAFSSLLAATAQRSQGDVAGFQPSFPQVWASGAAGQINQAGQQVTAKNLQIQPTITVRPGWSVNVLVSKDIILPPYSP